MNNISIIGVVRSKVLHQPAGKEPVVNLIVTDVVPAKKPSFQIPIWGEAAKQIDSEIQKGDTVRVAGFVTDITQNDYGPLIVLSNVEVSCINWKTIAVENGKGE